jgi:hypothetical protein
MKIMPSNFDVMKYLNTDFSLIAYLTVNGPASNRVTAGFVLFKTTNWHVVPVSRLLFFCTKKGIPLRMETKTSSRTLASHLSTYNHT